MTYLSLQLRERKAICLQYQKRQNTNANTISPSKNQHKTK